MQFFTITALVASSLLHSANAHMKMAHPVPYGVSSLQLGPLKPDGSDFPCQQRTGVYDAEGASNSAAVGDEVPLSFNGSAVHGGGSCQISLTTDKQPSKNSKWMVIYSIEGGCPTKSLGGNGQAGTNAADKYTFKIPEGISPGDYTLAWTWFDRLAGVPEMYMNCAPFTVTGGKKRAIEARKEAARMSKRAATFPDMYVANACGGCKTPEGKDAVFPDPGAYVDKFVTDHLAPATCSCNGPVSGASSSGSTSGSTSGSGSGSGTGSGSSSGAAPSSASGSGASAPLSSAVAAFSSAVPKPQATGDSAASPAASSAPAQGSSAAMPDTEPSPAPAAAPSPAPSPAASSGGSTSGGSAATPGTQDCSTPNTVVCSSDGNMFGICDINMKAVMITVATGTTCTNGAIAAKGS